MVAPLALLGLSVAADLVGGLVKGATGGATAPAGTPAAGAPAAGGKDKLRKAAQEFESVFLEQALDRLTENAGKDGPLGEAGTGGSVYRSMLAKEYAGAIVKSGGIGISGPVYRQMLQIQEGPARVG